MSASAVITIRRKRLVRRFREARAVDLEHAVTLEDLGERPSWIFDQMVRYGAFQPVSGGRYYMNERVAEEFLRIRSKRALLIAGLLLLAVLILFLFGVIGR